MNTVTALIDHACGRWTSMQSQDETENQSNGSDLEIQVLGLDMGQQGRI